MGPYCKFCDHRCFVTDTKRPGLLATCAAGKAHDLAKLGYCYERRPMVLRTETAWSLIGHDGPVRIVGGRTVYEAVDFSDATPGFQIRLSRLVPAASGVGIRQITRYVDPDTWLEVLR